MQNERTPEGGGRFWMLLTIFVLIVGVGTGGYFYYQHHEREKTKRKRLFPRMPSEQEAKIRESIRQMGRLVLKVTPEQEKKIEAIWVKMPESFEEVKEMNRKTDEVLMPTQRAMVVPFRSMIRNRAVDQITEPARKRLPPAAFEQFRMTIKTRVQQQIGQ